MANNAEFYYVLDQTFKKGTAHFAKAQKMRREFTEKDLEDLYNPNPTSIYIGVTIRKQYLKVNVGLKVKPQDWDFDAQEYKKRKNPDWYEYNNFLNSRMSEIRKRYLNLRMENNDIQPDQVKQMMIDVLKGKIDEIKKHDFFEVYDLFLEDKRKISKDGTIEKYTVLRLHLKAFEKSFYKLTFEKMTKQFDADFKYFSVNEKKHLNNTIARHIKCMKVFLRWAMEHPEKFHNNRDFEKFKVTNDESNIIALTMDEFTSICNLDLSDNPKLDRVRDLFLFQSLTGQRFSDISNIKFKDLRKTNEGLSWVLWQIKGNKKGSISIPLLDKAVAILEKYKGDKAPQANDTILPVISLTNMNLYLKELGKVANLTALESKVNYSGIKRVESSAEKWRVLSTHCARRTFVTLSLQMGMRPEIVRAITGHKTAQVMDKYVSINEKMKKVEFKEVWDKKIG